MEPTRTFLIPAGLSHVAKELEKFGVTLCPVANVPPGCVCALIATTPDGYRVERAKNGYLVRDQRDRLRASLLTTPSGLRQLAVYDSLPGGDMVSCDTEEPVPTG